MIFSVIILALVGVVAFFHYVQGFFSATLSAVISVLAAVLAVAYHETLVDTLLQGKMADSAHAMALVILYAAIYATLRFSFDAMIPGNVRFSPLIDKIGAGAMGVIAALFGVGIVAMAAAEMPFGPTIAGYSRYDVKGSRTVIVPVPGRQAIDSEVYDEVQPERLETVEAGEYKPAAQNHLIIPVDDLVVGMTSKLSDNGSLAGDRTVTSVHPDWLAELSAARLGIQNGAKKTAYAVRGQSAIHIDGIYRAASLPQTEGEITELRVPRETPLPAILKPEEGQMILVVRTVFSSNATDADNLFRFSCAAIRLKVGERNYHPLGTLEEGRVVYVDRPDDYLICESGKGADLVFVLPTDQILAGPVDPKNPEMKVADGTFLEVKKLARENLPGTIKSISQLTAKKDIATLRKPGAAPKNVSQQPVATPAPTAAPATPQKKDDSSDPLKYAPGKTIGL